MLFLRFFLLPPVCLCPVLCPGCRRWPLSLRVRLRRFLPFPIAWIALLLTTSQASTYRWLINWNSWFSSTVNLFLKSLNNFFSLLAFKFRITKVNPALSRIDVSSMRSQFVMVVLAPMKLNISCFSSACAAH